MGLLVLRFYLLIAGLAVVGALILGVVLKDRRWFRFAWQLLKFSLVALLAIVGAIVLGRLILIL